ncbi:MAG TPA: hypothetical protein VL426_00885 [Candidatus Binatia bacterium]|nr:hypothetical protein [Candidatus Binatia bacterium]
MHPQHPRPKKIRIPEKTLLAAAIVGVLVIAGAAALTARQAVASRGPETALRSLSAAVHGHDAEGAMRLIDFDAVFEDAWKASSAKITGKEPTEAQTAAALASPVVDQAKKTFRKNLMTFLKEPGRATGDSGAFFAALNALDAGRVEKDGQDRATAELPNGYSLQMVRRTGEGWKVVAFHGYEKDYDAYKKQAAGLMKDRGLTPKENGDPEPPPAPVAPKP